MHPYLHIGSISLPAYGVFCALGIVVSCVMTLFRARRFGIRADRMLFVYTAALVCGLLGAAFTYMLITYSPQELFSMLRRGAFLREYQPGYVFYGGFLFGAAAALLAARAVKTPVRALSRALLPCLPFAHALGRVGCFFAGCCYGREARWLPGVVYPENTEWVGAPAIRAQTCSATISVCTRRCAFSWNFCAETPFAARSCFFPRRSGSVSRCSRSPFCRRPADAPASDHRRILLCAPRC